MKTALEQQQEIARDRDERACRHAYDNRYHKIRAAVGYDEFRAIWFKALESHEVYEAELQRLAELGRNLPPMDDESEFVFMKVRKGLVKPSIHSLEHIVSLIANGTPFVVTSGVEGARLRKIVRLVDEKFASGNDIPVERITLTRDEVGLD
ncbi:hypothetical protein [Bordetella phage vB_BbrM_PHB04]|uniref:Uncharacterized protein n=1 Tax=Bordetella phage vB_BbrM_PHB04 TaxID=2029657 RepID=A0A291L9X4_9CAUD|nr:hypothetical protein HOS14_gp042 [Bordetella phage vB_BbrM_PHB04]ATI15660.1 hypothetical protein [Bordetella phage vB_BbrM_PHB04]